MTDDENAGSPLIVCVPLTDDRQVAGGWGRARRLAVASVAGGRILDWTEHDVHWDTLHDEATEGSHHARVARFLIDHYIDLVVAGHMGPPMAQMLATMGIRTLVGATGDAQAAVASTTLGS